MPAIRAKLFTHGGSQAVRLPKAFRLEGTEVNIRKEGDRVILEPVKTDWDAFWTRLDAMHSAPASEETSDPAGCEP